MSLGIRHSVQRPCGILYLAYTRLTEARRI